MTVTVHREYDGGTDIAVLEGVANEPSLDQLCRCVADQSVFSGYDAFVIDVSDVPSQAVPSLGELNTTARTLAAQHRWLTVVDRRARPSESRGPSGLIFADKASALRAIHRLVRLVTHEAPRYPRARALTDLTKMATFPLVRFGFRVTYGVTTTPLRLTRSLLGR